MIRFWHHPNSTSLGRTRSKRRPSDWQTVGPWPHPPQWISMCHGCIQGGPQAGRYKWSCIYPLYKWSYKWVTGVITRVRGVVTVGGVLTYNSTYNWWGPTLYLLGSIRIQMCPKEWIHMTWAWDWDHQSSWRGLDSYGVYKGRKTG